MSNNLIEYRNDIERISNKINKLEEISKKSSIKINTNDLKKEVETIIKEHDKELDNSYKSSNAAVKMMKESKNNAAKQKLDELEMIVDSYDETYQILLKCNAILEDDYIDTKELSDSISSLLIKLNALKEKDMLNDEYSDEVVERLYKAVYLIIKEEIVQRGSSYLLKNVVTYDLGINILENQIRKDIKKIDLNDKENKLVREKYDELNASLSSSLLDEDLIFLITISLNPELKDKFNKELERIESRKEEIESYKEEKKEELDNFSTKVKKARKKKNINYLFSAGWFLSAALCVISCITARTNVKKDKYMYNTYGTTKEIYDTYDGYSKLVKDYYDDVYTVNDTIVKRYLIDEQGNVILNSYDMGNTELDTEELSKLDYSRLVPNSSEIVEDTTDFKGEHIVIEKIEESSENDVIQKLDEESYNRKISNEMINNIVTAILSLLFALRRKYMGNAEKTNEEIYQYDYDEVYSMLMENKKEMNKIKGEYKDLTNKEKLLTRTYEE